MQRLWRNAGALLLFSVFTVWIVDFRPAYLGTHLPGGLGDPVFNLYILEWGRHSLAHGLRGFWDANFFFPSTDVITFSDHLLGPAIQASALRLLWNNGVAAYGVLFLTSYVLSAAAVAWVLRREGTSRTAAVLAAIMFAFSPYRSTQDAHIQVLLVQWMPLALWWWDRLLGAPRIASAAWFLVFYLLHVSGGNYLAYFLHMALGFLLLQHARDWRRLLSWPSLRVVLPPVAAGAAVTVALFAPSLAARSEHGLERASSEITFFGATPRSYFSADRDNPLWGRILRRGRPENRLFAGLLPTVFAGIGAVSLVRRRRRARAEDATALPPGHVSAPSREARGGDTSRRPTSTFERGVLWSGLFFLLLSFTPVFLVLTRVLPGLGSMRVPTRGYPFVSLALVVLAARGIDALLAWISDRDPRAAPPSRGETSGRGARRPALVAVAIALGLCVELDSRISWRPWPDPPALLGIFHEIGRRPEVRVTAHLPMIADAREARYMYYSSFDWKPIANGYSGYAPPEWVDLQRRLDREPAAATTIDRLFELGVTHVATHPHLISAPRGRRRLARFERHWTSGAAPRLRLVAAAGEDRLYELLPPPDAARQPEGAPVVNDGDQTSAAATRSSSVHGPLGSRS
jgi:hypothetical protein